MTESLRAGAEPAPSRIGAELAQARERLGLSVDEIGAALRIRAAYLSALERGCLSELPSGKVYVLAFLRSYAAALGLDAEAIIRRFKAEAWAPSWESALVFPAPFPERRLPSGAVALLASVLAIGVYAGWYRLSGEEQMPAETIARVPARLVPLAAPMVAAVAPSRPDPASAKPAAAPAESSPLNALAADASVAPISPGSAAAAVPIVAKAAAPAAEAPPPSLIVRAIADSWLQVRDRTGAVVLSRVLRSGETWEVPPIPGLVLTTGNAGGMVLVVDGAQTVPLGAPGVVRRDIVLDPSAAKAGRLAAIAAAR